MNATERLSYFLNLAIDKAVASKKYTTTATELINALPDCVKTLHEIVVSPQTSVRDRLEALGIIQKFWSRLLDDQQHETRAAVARLQNKTRKARVNADRRKTDLLISKERKQIDAALLEMESAIGRKDG